jgi:outer membrane biosynthesis protein TonB
MTGSRRGIGLIIGFLALVVAGAATAQENLDEGKTPAQLYEADCAICHKTTRGLSRVGGIGGLESFLREHYTASRESAAAIASYLRQVDRGPLPAERGRTARPRREEHRKPAEKEKSAEKKSVKPDEAKASEKKPGEVKSTEKKPDEAKATDKKPAEAKATDKKPDAAKATSSKPSKPKATDAEASAPKSSTDKPDKPKDAKPAE